MSPYTLRHRAPHLRTHALTPALILPRANSIHSISDQSLVDAFEFSQGTFQFKWLAHVPAGVSPLPLLSLHSL